MTYKEQKFIFYLSGGWEFQDHDSARLSVATAGKDLLPGAFSLSLHGEGAREFVRSLVLRFMYFLDIICIQSYVSSGVQYSNLTFLYLTV